MGYILEECVPEERIQCGKGFSSDNEKFMEREQWKNGNPEVQMTLKELTKSLEFISQKAILVRFDFVDFFPTFVDFWGGANDEVAIGYKSEGHPPSVTEFLKLLKGAIGKPGKSSEGVNYEITPDAPVWVANSGQVGQTAVMDVLDNEDEVILITGFCEH